MIDNVDQFLEDLSLDIDSFRKKEGKNKNEYEGFLQNLISQGEELEKTLQQKNVKLKRTQVQRVQEAASDLASDPAVIAETGQLEVNFFIPKVAHDFQDLLSRVLEESPYHIDDTTESEQT